MTAEEVFAVSVEMTFYVLAEDADVALSVVDDVAFIGTKYLRHWGAVATAGSDPDVRQIGAAELAPRTLEDLQCAAILRERIKRIFAEDDRKILGTVGSPVADAVIAQAKEGGWIGTSAALLRLLNVRGVEPLPVSPAALVECLVQFLARLEAAGVAVRVIHEEETDMSVIEIRREA